MRSRFKASALALCLGLQLAAGCNGVLDIEEARLDPSRSGISSCERPNVSPSVECKGAADQCENCLNNCDSTLASACLGDSSCRKALVDYRLCLGNDCTGAGRGCSACLSGSGNGPAKKTGACLGACATECAGSGVFSLCELYCACMQDQNHCGAPAANCMTECVARDTWKTHCWLGHCERAPDPTSEHCEHARGLGGGCTDKAENLRGTCGPPKIWTGFPCAKSSECCSGVCSEAEICLP